jgi:predicted RNA-binding protein YlxR (DUF448 family)
LYKKLKTLADEARLERSYTEKRIAELTVQDGARARYVGEQLKKLKTAEEKNAYVKDLKQKKILTDEVFKQLKQMLANGELQ